MAVEDKSRKTRPVNLNLWTMHFPITAIVSILHRLSGVVLFLSVPFLVWLLNLSLSSPDNFTLIQTWFSQWLVKFVIWAVLLALVYHLLAGLRHLVMDFGFSESLRAGRRGAYLIMGMTIFVGICLGIWLW